MNKKQINALMASFSDGEKTSEMMLSTVSEWYDAKHRAASAEETRFVNSIRPPRCPHCLSERILRKGIQKKTGLQTWMCGDCGRRFNPLTQTIFDSRKIPVSEWIEYLIHLFEYHSVSTSAKDNRNAVSTGFYWLEKVFLVLKDYQSGIILAKKVWLDETYVPAWKSKAEKKGGKGLRGLSRNQFCVCGGTDGGKCFLVVCGTRKPSSGRLAKACKDHIAAGSTLIHDGELSHRGLIEELSLKSVVHKSCDTADLDDKDNPMEKINKVHRLLKRFMESHGGYTRDELQDWLNLFCFIWNEKGSKERKAQLFIERAIKTRVSLRYRAWKSQKSDDGSEES